MSTSLPRVVGIDLSLTGTGLALPDGTLHTITTGPGDHIWDQHSRLAYIVEQVIELAEAGTYPGLVLAVVEGPSYSSKGAGTWDRAGLWWLAIDRLIENAVPLAIVPPSNLKLYGHGKGTANKADMRMALYQRTGADVRDDNRVDAAWLRLMGLDKLGHPQVDMPKNHRQALDKVTWPTRLEAS
ncbi:hypothetical protein EDD29_0128 [Actinocorallia herbida]|uniref:Uncharacterized protein n=1 Tax=Actinocorallia herbida TaxID=58109 RepID=A0A3N1CMW0_9ACTN|nr:Holliday junction endonuclease [Actinocorallia herbida]ROO82647.1 hypothetical protein EDD29_0128 [Actinocorallia herbida]